MAVTPRGIVTPNASDDYDLVVDLAAMANSIDTAIGAEVIDGSQVTTGTVAAARLPNLQDLNGTLDVASGGTGATTAPVARDNLDVGYVLIGEALEQKLSSTGQLLTTANWTDATNSTVTVTHTGRKARVTVRVIFRNGGSGAVRSAGMRILQNGNVLNNAELSQIPVTYFSTSDQVNAGWSDIITPSAGSYTYKVSVKASTGNAIYVDYVYLTIEEFH